MPVICQGCGRPYPAERFKHGRTLHCACGTHVVGPTAVRDLAADEPPRFFADAMLGGLARWLRMLGFDASHDDRINDAELVERSIAEGRLLLTRDRRLASHWRIEGLLVLESDKPVAQLAELDRRHPLGRFARPFTRCSRCNTLLVPAPVAEFVGRVPEHVLRSTECVAYCPGCQRVYWEGSHTARMRRTLSEVVASLDVCAASAGP